MPPCRSSSKVLGKEEGAREDTAQCPDGLARTELISAPRRRTRRLLRARRLRSSRLASVTLHVGWLLSNFPTARGPSISSNPSLCSRTPQPSPAEDTRTAAAAKCVS